MDTERCPAAAAECTCKRAPGHAGPHECAEDACNGAWTGTYDEDDFTVVRWPSGDGDLILDLALRIVGGGL